MAHCLTPAKLDAALADEPEAVAAMIVSPTYFGAVADVAALADVAHARGVPLVVDEAWGAHMHFSSALPTAALESGADVVLSSVHKIVGSITQSAILHLGAGDRVDERIVDRAVTLIETTSPNAILTASLDAARRQAATRGEELLAETVGSLGVLRDRIRAVPGLDVLDERIVGRAGVYDYDPLRLVIDVRGTGATGHRIARLMREQDDINLELFAENVVVAVFGIGEHAAVTGARLVEALEHACERLGEEEEEPLPPFAEPPPWGPTELSPREAFLAGQEVVGFAAAEGRIAAESLAAYPPGVPNVLPGERLTVPTLTYIADSVAHGGLVRGASDRTLKRSGWWRMTRICATSAAPHEHLVRGFAGTFFRPRRPFAAPHRPRFVTWGADSETGACAMSSSGPRTTSSGGRRARSPRPRWRAGRSSTASSPSPSTASWSRSTSRPGSGCTCSSPTRPLPYQVFARDSSVMTPGGAVVTQMAQPWRRGEYAEVIRFYQRNEIPIANMITAGSLEGGDVCMVEPGVMLIGNGEERTTVEAARQLAGWMEAEGWEVRIEPIPSQFLHIDVLVSILAPKLAAVCVESASGGLVAWLRDKGFEIVEVSTADAFKLGVNAIALGDERVLSTAGSAQPQRARAGLGLEVLDPDLSMFTMGGGGAHCLAQALDRDPG